MGPARKLLIDQRKQLVGIGKAEECTNPQHIQSPCGSNVKRSGSAPPRTVKVSQSELLEIDSRSDIELFPAPKVSNMKAKSTPKSCTSRNTPSKTSPKLAPTHDRMSFCTESTTDTPRNPR